MNNKTMFYIAKQMYRNGLNTSFVDKDDLVKVEMDDMGDDYIIFIFAIKGIGLRNEKLIAPIKDFEAYFKPYNA